MAEIKIEKKKPIWPWIILVLIILAILYFLVFANDTDDDDMEIDDTEQLQEETTWEDEDEMTTWDEESDTTAWDTTATDTLGGTEAGISGYLSHVSDKSKMGVDHQYTNNALLRLVDAVQAKANEINYDVQADMQSVRQDANAIEQDPSAENHANKIKQAGTKLANILEKMQKDNYPDLSQDVQEMKTAANNIEGSVKTLEQKDQINKFFDEAADVLRKMS